MAWVAFDRAVLLAEQLKYKAPVEKWRTLRDTIHAEVCAKAYDAQKKSFMQAYGSNQLDASLLLMPVVGFLPGTDPRVRNTVEAIERELMPRRPRPALRHAPRWKTACRPAKASSSPAASGWYRASKPSAASPTPAALFDRLIQLRNDLGLLSEEYDLERKRLVGNFPQAFSHIALVNAAFDLDDGIEVRERSHRHAKHAAAAD